MPLRRLLAPCVGAVLFAGCTPSSGPEPPQASPTETAAHTLATDGTTTTTVALPEPVPVAWQACGGGFDCAAVTVPVDYADPAAGALELSLVRRPADDPAQRIGTLLVNPGGPGASGVRRVRRGFTVSPEVGQRFDVVGFDPRGVGDSTPITCGGTVGAFRSSDLDPDTPDEEAALLAAAQAVADECARTEGARLAHLGILEVVHDVEVIRRALAEPQVSFVGLSYGTLIGLLWADAYPASVRALVLDGVVDPAAGHDTASVEQVAALEDVVAAMAESCTTDPTCPLHPAGGMLAAYDDLAGRIESGAVTRPGVGPTQLAYAVFFASYDASHWPRLWHAIAAGLAGDLGPLGDLAESFTRLVPYATFALITCLDSRHPVGVEAWLAQGDALARRSPRFGRVMSNELLPCASWPQSRYVPRTVAAEGAPPVLVIGSTGDAATPYHQAEAVARALDDGVLLTVDVDGHVAIGDSDCATAAVTRYLVDLAVPTPGTRC